MPITDNPIERVDFRRFVDTVQIEYKLEHSRNA